MLLALIGVFVSFFLLVGRLCADRERARSVIGLNVTS